MKIRIVSGVLLAGLLAAGYANAECTYPKAPASLPDGKTATEQEMLAGRTAVMEYQEKVNAYTACLDSEMKDRVQAAGTEAPADQVEQIKAIHAKRHNAAVEELEAVAARFNEQLRAYKTRTTKKS
jgi:hypothetical protein